MFQQMFAVVRYNSRTEGEYVTMVVRISRYSLGRGDKREVADACECGNEPSGSVKCGEFLD